MKTLLCMVVLLAAGTRLFADPPAPELLTTEPNEQHVEVTGIDLAKHSGFVIWTPTLTLMDVITAAGGLTARADLIQIDKRGANPPTRHTFSREQVLTDQKVQQQHLDPKDRLLVTHWIYD